MCRLRETQEHHVDKAFPDCWRRLAPEVLVANTYSRASDVFTFATMVWEVFNARDISTIKPNARIEDFEPCADISRDSVLSFVRENTELPKPELCPHWLHSLVLDCRHSIPSKRPTAADILNILRQHLSGASPPKPFIIKYLCDPAPENRSSEETTEKFEADTCAQKSWNHLR
ncbi:ephrin type-A receptor 8-like [Pomacea canaliculata]|uniref:ephrin type-A receptor 8-like n=1 Tax=Pomacea canaliculata TaxID=400727 RepID=UPI000D731C67|nr:ephrin type-A receptor 8-like [Pomacea canaliculata]